MSSVASIPCHCHSLDGLTCGPIRMDHLGRDWSLAASRLVKYARLCVNLPAVNSESASFSLMLLLVSADHGAR